MFIRITYCNFNVRCRVRETNVQSSLFFSLFLSCIFTNAITFADATSSACKFHDFASQSSSPDFTHTYVCNVRGTRVHYIPDVRATSSRNVVARCCEQRTYIPRGKKKISSTPGRATFISRVSVEQHCKRLIGENIDSCRLILIELPTAVARAKLFDLSLFACAFIFHECAAPFEVTNFS